MSKDQATLRLHGCKALDSSFAALHPFFHKNHLRLNSSRDPYQGRTTEKLDSTNDDWKRERRRKIWHRSITRIRKSLIPSQCKLTAI